MGREPCRITPASDLLPQARTVDWALVQGSLLCPPGAAVAPLSSSAHAGIAIGSRTNLVDTSVKGTHVGVGAATALDGGTIGR
jgi:hypothetical protein